MTTGRGDETILVVDDEAPVLAIAERMLQSLGYAVVTANSGTQGVELFEVHPEIDLVILDIIMPHMGGHETFERLRAIRANVPVLLASGYSLDADAQQLLNVGCCGFLHKPFTLANLSAKVHEALQSGSAPSKSPD